ncbi:RNA-binding S4 domain-containing protein [Thalassococcus sp. S3]|uniref:RNA-binding S4 domain-containing protein n=1 Tax=Thalassococcus sp. S3 TaxID=2017482 RepID=UPI0010248AC3|nr:RNA-binding S4 domain-containing protein [Thalassococcus sp. S3]QBF32431.1 RNA-binding protein S4 [Thalassococcus sp. S3]
MTEAPVKLRLDKWLWHARFFKTRSLAARQVAGGHVRVNGDKTDKPARSVCVGDVLTFAQARQVRVVRIEALGVRRGPAPEAQTLYTEIGPDPERPAEQTSKAPGFDGTGRPTKRDRRAYDLSRRRSLE